MYKLSFTTVKKGNRLSLYRDKEYIKSITRRNKNKYELIELLKSKIDLDINWEELIYNKCGWCGKKFERSYKYRKYCSEKCSYEALLERNRQVSKKIYEYNKKIRKTIKYEYINNKGYFPKGFTEFDEPNTIGESKLKGKPNENKKKEYELIQKELRRIGLR